MALVMKVNGKRLSLVMQRYPYPNPPAFWCVECGEVSLLKNRGASFMILIGCPKCGARTSATYISKDRNENRVLHDVSIFKERDKTSVALTYAHPLINDNELSISWKASTAKYLLDTKTGQTYAFPWKYEDGTYVTECREIENVTYEYVEHYIPTDALKALQGIVAPHIDPVEALTDFNSLKLANAYPQLTKQQLVQCGQFLEHRKVAELTLKMNLNDLFRGIVKSDEPSMFINKICTNLGIPTSKGNRKMVQDFMNVKRLVDVTDCGFCNFDCRRNITMSFNRINEFDMMYVLHDELTQIFIKELIEEKGEIAVAKLFIRVNGLMQISDDNDPMLEEDVAESYVKFWTELRDSARMWQEFKLVNMANPRYLRKSNIGEIHHRLVLDLPKVQETIDNTPISYSVLEREMECTIDGFQFKLATTKKKMVVAGGELDICVGAKFYTDGAFNKRITMLFVVRDDAYKVCIELQPCETGFMMSQCKARFNKFPEGEVTSAIRKWASRNSIDTSKCYDFKWMK